MTDPKQQYPEEATTAPKPAPCPRHPDAEPYITGGLASKAVSCGNPGCWYGPRAGTESEAIALWNAVVEAAARLPLIASNQDRAAVHIGRDFVTEMAARTVDGQGVLSYALRPTSVPGLDLLVVTRTESPLPTPDATRLAAVVRAAQDVAAESHPRLHLDALVALDKALAALNADDLALLERWGRGK